MGGACLLFAFAALAFDVNTLPPQGYHTGPIDYWRAPYFANAIAIDPRNWIDKASGDTIYQSSGQLNANGYPLYLETGQIIKTLSIGMEGDWHKPSTWPDRDEFYEGQVVLTWKGDADVRIVNYNAAFISGKSNTSPTGSAVDGRRVYLMPEDSAPYVEIHAINTNNPVTDVKCWLPDPADPQNSSLENQFFHPYFLELVNDRDWGWIRTMTFGTINQNPQKDWVDRRPGNYAFQEGVLNERRAADGVWYYDGNGDPVYFATHRLSGTSFETMVALCNEADKDLWVTVPHMATDDFVTKMAQLFRYGSDGFDPYTSPQADPVFPPLHSNLTVFVEYSNEIWASGGEFSQGNWAQDQADLLGISKAQFNARQFSRVWNLFENQMGTSRVVRVASAWTANPSYTDEFINELYDTTLLHPEVMAVTTYFGNGIQNWANDQHFVPTNSIPPTTPATPWDSDYWTSPELEEDLAAMFKQWERYIIAGLSYGGPTGYDNIDKPGGFGSYLRDIGIARNLPLVAYEGGPSIYTDQIDRGGSENDFDDGITLLMIEANRRQTFGDLYEIHINQAFERGLRANVGFIDVDQWGKFGQWGHLEYLGQPLEEAVKYQTLLNTYDTFSLIRSIDNPQGAQPQFDTSAELPRAETFAPYSQTIAVSGGDGPLTVELIGLSLPPGLSYDSGTRTISGTPQASGTAYVYLRVVDADHDPAWRTFTFSVVQRSSDPAVTIDFEGQTGIENQPIPVQPLIIGDYTFRCPTYTNGLAIRSTTVGWPSGWTSKVLHGKNWNNALSIERVDGGPFDLLSVEIGSVETASCKITATQTGGGTTEIIVNNPILDHLSPPLVLTHVELDLVSVTRVDFTYYRLPDADPNISNAIRFGALDNLQLNQISPGPYALWAGTIDWDGADSSETGDPDGDGILNAMERAMDLDPMVADAGPTTLTTDPPHIDINYRRSTLATNVTWQLMGSSNLLSSWSVWAVDDIRVFSDLLDPDIDGDGSAELMRYRVLTNEEDQHLFFSVDVL